MVGDLRLLVLDRGEELPGRLPHVKEAGQVLHNVETQSSRQLISRQPPKHLAYIKKKANAACVRYLLRALTCCSARSMRTVSAALKFSLGKSSVFGRSCSIVNRTSFGNPKASDVVFEIDDWISCASSPQTHAVAT